MSLGAFLKKCRRKAGMSQIDLAFELNINQSDVSKIETDSKEPPTSIFKDWTIATQSMELGVAFLYGTELLTVIPDILNTVTLFINFM